MLDEQTNGIACCVPLLLKESHDAAHVVGNGESKEQGRDKQCPKENHHLLVAG